jgi:hypothetical protein
MESTTNQIDDCICYELLRLSEFATRHSCHENRFCETCITLWQAHYRSCLVCHDGAVSSTTYPENRNTNGEVGGTSQNRSDDQAIDDLVLDSPFREGNQTDGNVASPTLNHLTSPSAVGDQSPRSVDDILQPAWGDDSEEGSFDGQDLPDYTYDEDDYYDNLLAVILERDVEEQWRHNYVY